MRVAEIQSPSTIRLHVTAVSVARASRPRRSCRRLVPSLRALNDSERHVGSALRPIAGVRDYECDGNRTIVQVGSPHELHALSDGQPRGGGDDRGAVGGDKPSFDCLAVAGLKVAGRLGDEPLGEQREIGVAWLSLHCPSRVGWHLLLDRQLGEELEALATVPKSEWAISTSLKLHAGFADDDGSCPHPGRAGSKRSCQPQRVRATRSIATRPLGDAVGTSRTHSRPLPDRSGRARRVSASGDPRDGHSRPASRGDPGGARGCLVCPLPAPASAIGAEVTLVVGDGRRAGYEISCVVASPADDSPALLSVMDVARVKPRRRHARAGVSESGMVRHMDEEMEFDVKVVDVGPDGVAFISDRPLVVGDSVSGMLDIARRSFPIQARVVHIQPLGFGRVRIGCQFTDIGKAYRELLDQIAKEAPSDRRGLRPIELVDDYPHDCESSAASITDLHCHYEAVRIPTLRYCRPCGRITLHRNTALPGDPPEWKCPNC